MNPERQLSCVISGSFDKAKFEIDKAIDNFTQLGVKVLAPEKGWIYLPLEKRTLNFRPLPSEINKSIKDIENDFLNKIIHSDFLYVVNLNGYVGNSSALEIGFAISGNKQIYAAEPIAKIYNEGSFGAIVSSIKILTPEQILVDFYQQE